ncbi:hypothetical protein QR98_0050900 [Sarcoptes scabiei]|uniref:Uncharacterized protein n=1 Tax=Sarcoptes scabiei TaxID=52283 RepID=A0A132A6L4_SARSC|nr:hypothetical protein QR98_0050900 [Sarcoptes scabiei]
MDRRLQQRFEMEPIDKTSITGDTIILPCRVANKVGTLQCKSDYGSYNQDSKLKNLKIKKKN